MQFSNLHFSPHALKTQQCWDSHIDLLHSREFAERVAFPSHVLCMTLSYRLTYFLQSSCALQAQ